MVTETDGTCSLNDPAVLVTDKPISRVTDLMAIAEAFAKTGLSKLAIFADDVEGEALSTLALNIKLGKLQSVAVRGPNFGIKRKQYLEDIATITGATFFQKKQDEALRPLPQKTLVSVKRYKQRKIIQL